MKYFKQQEVGNVYGFILLPIVLIVAIIVAVALFFYSGTVRTAEVQAQELFTLYFDIDKARTSSAEIFAELLELKRSPERANIEEDIGSPKSLRSREELTVLLSTSRSNLNEVLVTVDSKNFADEGVMQRHRLVRDFYVLLAEFEENVLNGLEDVSDDGFSRFIDEIFETGSDWPILLQADKELRDSLTFLAQIHGLDFEAEAYDETFRKRLGKLRLPVISDKLGQIKYDFEVPEKFTQENVSVSWTGVPIDKLVFGLEHPDGRIINFRIIEVPEEKGGPSTLRINNLPTDGTEVTIPGEIYPRTDGSSYAYGNSQIHWEAE